MIIIVAIHVYYYFDYYRSNVLFFYYATLLRLRRECHLHNLNLTCFGPVQSFDLLGWGSHVFRVLSKITKRWGRMSLGCSQKLNFAPSPRTFLLLISSCHVLVVSDAIFVICCIVGASGVESDKVCAPIPVVANA
jgi:hypothetical protein